MASSALAPRGGDNVLLIDWASWAEFRNLQKGEAGKVGMRDALGGAEGRVDSQSTNKTHQPLSHIDMCLMHELPGRGDLAVLWEESCVDLK